MPLMTHTPLTNSLQTVEQEVLLFQELLEGFTTGEEVEEEHQVEEKPVQPEYSKEAPPAEMDEALIQAMQQFIRLPFQQPVGNKGQPMVENQAIPARVLSPPTPELLQPLVEQDVKADRPVESEEALIEKDWLTVESNELEQVPEAEHTETQVSNDLDIPAEFQEEALKQPTMSPEILKELVANKNQEVPTNVALEKNSLEPVSQTEPQIVSGVQQSIQPAAQTVSSTTEVTRTSMTWQEPSQVIRELGSTITVTLEQSPTPETKVVQIALTPETFGEMEIQLTWQEDRVSARIVVQKPEIKQQLVEQLDLIREFLPKNPIVHTIAIDVRPLDMPFQAHQGLQPRKQGQQNSKHHSSKEKEWEEQERAGAIEGNGLSLYI